MRFDAAREMQPVAGEMLLRRRDHGVEAVVAVALPRRVDVGAVVGPGLRHQLATPLGLRLVPRRQVTHHDFV